LKDLHLTPTVPGLLQCHLLGEGAYFGLEMFNSFQGF
jgi:hypothetical protein